MMGSSSACRLHDSRTSARVKGERHSAGVQGEGRARKGACDGRQNIRTGSVGGGTARKTAAGDQNHALLSTHPSKLTRRAPHTCKGVDPLAARGPLVYRVDGSGAGAAPSLPSCTASGTSSPSGAFMPPPPEQRWQESECEGCQARACRRPCRTGGGGGGSGGGGGGPKKRGQRTAPLHAVREPSASLPAGCKSGSICATQGSAARPPGPASALELASSSPITDGSGTRARSRSLAGARAMRRWGAANLSRWQRQARQAAAWAAAHSSPAENHKARHNAPRQAEQTP